MKKQNRMALLASASILMLAAQSSFAGVTLLGSPFTPTNANFSLTSLQGINPSNLTGTNGGSQVNRDFEFKDAIGVSYNSGGKLNDFGLGLYLDAQKQIQSTGLQITYNDLVSAYSVKVTVEDFDIHAGKDVGYNVNKVEPGILLLGANNAVLANILPGSIFPAMVPNNSVPNGAKDDTWDINFSNLLASLSIADQPISGFILYADQTLGEKNNSDPYLLIAIGNGIPVIPEPGTYVVGGVAIALAALHTRKLRKQRMSA